MPRGPFRPILLLLGLLLLVIGVAGGHWFADVTGVAALVVAGVRWRLGAGAPTAGPRPRR